MAKQQWTSKTSASPSVRKPRAARWTDESRSRVRKSANLVVPATLLVVTIIVLVMVLQWLDPVPAPTLFVLTTRTSPQLLPPNDAAANDALLLTGLEGTFNTSAANPQPATLERMRDILSLVRDLPPRRPLLAFWKPSTLVVYVNAIGVGLPGTTAMPEGRAWLVPEGFDPDGDLGSQLLPVRELMKAVAESDADQKLVVFDCQRSAVEPHVGFAATEFVNAAQHDISEMAEEDAGQLRGVSVLYSCGPGEASWPMHPHATSVFGYYFAEGFSGAADQDAETGDGDDRVSVEELGTYLARHVGDWVEKNCRARQRPFSGRTNRAVLISVGDQPEIHPQPIATRGSLEEDLTTASVRCYELAQPASSPGEWAPVKWTAVQDRLLSAERLYRAGNIEGAANELAAFDDDVETLVAAHASIRNMISLSSPAASEFLSRCCADGWRQFEDDGTNSVAADTAGVLADAISGVMTLDDADQRLREITADSREPLSAPAQFLRLAIARNRSGVGLDEARVHGALERRIEAEAVAQPRYCLAGPWLRSEISASDGIRRHLEDQLLLDDWAPLPVGPEPAAIGGSEPPYTDNGDRHELLTRSFRLRDRLLAELPYWISFLDRSEAHILPVDTNEPADTSDGAAPEMNFPVIADTTVRSLVDELERLHKELLRDPVSMNGAQLEANLSALSAAAAHVESELERLHSGLARYVELLSQQRTAPSGGDTWRRIDAVLQLPISVLASPSDADGAGSSAAQLRMAVLKRSLAGIEQDSSPPADARSLTSEQLEEQRQAIERLSFRVYSLPLDESGAEEANAADVIDGFLSGDIRARLIALAETTSETDRDHAEGLRADVAFRLLRRGLGTDLTVFSPAIQVRTQELSEWLLWQARRANADFYAAVEEGREPYFARLAGELLTGSQRLANAEEFFNRTSGIDGTDAPDELPIVAGGDTPQSRVREQTDALLALLESTALTLAPSRIEFRLTASERLNVGFSESAKFPSGTAAVRLESETVVPRVVPDDVPLEFVLQPSPSRSDDAAPDTSVAGYYRGHEFTAPLAVTVVTEADGPAFIYRGQNVGPARLRFRANRSDDEPLNLLFVLDCSQSMAQPDSAGQPRIDSLRAVLEAFSRTIRTDNVRVGIRLFGHSVADVRAPEAHTDTALVVPIGRLGPGPLQTVLTRLRAPLIGHSPIFNALLASRQDFADVGAGRNEIVLISDGVDNWSRAGEKPGLDELIDAFRGSEIRINTIGFDVDATSDLTQLQQIASAGGFEGESVTVENAQSLLWEVAGLIGLPGFRVLDHGRVIHQQSQFSDADRFIELDPGEYDVEVVGPLDDVLARQTIRVAAAEDHVLVFDSGRLRYQDSPRVDVPGDETRPDLVALDVRPDVDGTTLEFGLLAKPEHPLNAGTVSVRITAANGSGTLQEWYLRHLPPNVSRVHFPMWRVTLEGLPAAATEMELRVNWDDLPTEEIPVPLDWDLRLTQRAVGRDLSLVRREQQQLDFGGGPQTAASLTFVLNERGSGIEDWAVVVPGAVSLARQAYGYREGIYNIEFIPVDGRLPDEVSVIHTATAPADRHLSVTVPLANTRINP